MPDSGRKRGLVVVGSRVMMVGEGAKSIEGATDAEKAYLAAVIDCDGYIGIKGPERKEQLVILVGMEDLLPYYLWKEYGGSIYNRYNKPRKDGSRGLSYLWYVGLPKPHRFESLRKFIVMVGPFSRVKRKQFDLMLEAVDIKIEYYRTRMPDDALRRMTEIKEQIQKLNHTDPPYFEIKSRSCAGNLSKSGDGCRRKGNNR